MKKKISKILKDNIGNIIFLTVIIGIIFFWFSRKMQQRVVFMNYSGRNIKSVEISVGDQKINLKDLPVGSNRSKRIDVNQNAAFYIKITFTDESIIEEKSIGYITKNDKSDNFFTINSDKEILFSQRIKNYKAVYQ